MENNKKPTHRRPWFIPLIITVTTIILSALDVIRVGPTSFLCLSPPCTHRIETTIFFHALLTTPIIALIWFIFGICMLIIYLTKKSSKKSENNDKTLLAQPEKSIKSKSHTTLPILAIIFSAIYILINYRYYLLPLFYTSMSSYDSLRYIFVFVLTSPLGITGLILSAISMVKFRKRSDKTKKESTLDIINIITIIILFSPFILGLLMALSQSY